MRAWCFILALSLGLSAFAQSDEQKLRIKSDAVVLALKERNYEVLAAYMKTGGKLRFAPYVHLTSSDRLLSVHQVRIFFGTTGIKNWGEQDGTGDPILLTTTGYHNRYVYRKDFATSTSVTFNARVATGNLMSNFATFYPGRAFYEYYMPAANPGDLDWSAINVVWQKNGSGTWCLVAIVNDEWTT